MSDRCHINAVVRAKQTKYFMSGSGPCVVLLHGYMEDHRVWEPIVPALKDFTIIIPDMPGSGKDVIPENTDAIEFMADVVHELLLGLGTERYSVVGNSMGGYVAFRMIKKYGKFIDKAVLLSTNPFPDTAKDKRRRTREIDLLKHGKKDLIFKVFINSLDERFRELYRRMSKDMPSENMVSLQTSMMNRPDNRDVFEEPPVPVHYMFGEDDTLIPVERIKALVEQCSKIRSELVKEATHFLVAEKPAVAQRFIVESLKR